MRPSKVHRALRQAITTNILVHSKQPQSSLGTTVFSHMRSRAQVRKRVCVVSTQENTRPDHPYIATRIADLGMRGMIPKS